MAHPAELLAQVASDLDAVLSDNTLANLSDADRVRVLQAAGAVARRVDAVVVECLASTNPVDLAHGAGCRSPQELLQRTLLVDGPAAGRVVKVAGLVRRESSVVSGEWLPARWPGLREALLDGVIGVAGVLAATGPVERIHYRIGAEERLVADAFLADTARGLTAEDDAGDGEEEDGSAGASREVAGGPGVLPEDLGRLAQQIALVLDPDGPELDDQYALQRRGLTIGRLHNGLHRITGHLLPDAAGQLQLILDAMLNPKVDGPPHPTGVRFTPSTNGGADRGLAGDGGGPSSAEAFAPGRGAVDQGGVGGLRSDLLESVPPEAVERDPWNEDPRAVTDSRTHTQKRHDAFAAALEIAARHQEMPSLGGAAPTLVVTVDAADLAAGTGRARLLGSDATIPTAAAVHTACSGVIQRVLVDEGRIVGITVTDRVFTVHQRRAIIARDTECLIPGCHVPAAWCEIHHVTEHARGGPTSTDNGVPLCWWHHRSLDTSGWEIRMNNGTPQVRGPAWWDPTKRWHTPTHTPPSLHAPSAEPPPYRRHEQPQLLAIGEQQGRAAVDEMLSRTG